MIRPGGVAFDIDPARAKSASERVRATLKEWQRTADRLWDSPGVMARIEDTATLAATTARQLGLVGVAARGCGLERDVRYEFPAGIWRVTQIPVSTWTNGDAFSRSFVRWLEIQHSTELIANLLASLPEGAVRVEVGPPLATSLVVSLVESWRGEICHVALTDEAGKFLHYKVVDASFHNWPGMIAALKGQAVSDVALGRVSFAVSAPGHDI